MALTPEQKEQRRNLIKQRHEASVDKEAFGVISISDKEITETAEELDGFREHKRDVQTDSEFITSDEVKQ